MSRVTVLPAPSGAYDVRDQTETRRLMVEAVRQVGADVDQQTRRRGTEATAAPTSGTWRQGDVVWNAAPVAGGFVGWVCVVSGSPGTWRTFGAITP